MKITKNNQKFSVFKHVFTEFNFFKEFISINLALKATNKTVQLKKIIKTKKYILYSIKNLFKFNNY